ncbi:MAG: hypothetical protein LBT53_03680 [Puniceicoccales bacterium]|jgi:rubrerythrin|nr:hypothetical protein [Puniceicoccales bacterium]
MSLEADTFAALLVAAGIALIFALWFLGERRSARFFDRRALRRTFRCAKCGTLYSATTTAPVANCPNCAFANPRLSF